MMHRWACPLSLNRLHFKFDRAFVDDEDIVFFSIEFLRLYLVEFVNRVHQ